MRPSSKFALEAAKEITVARMSNVNISATQNGGESVAAFYEAFFRKINELAREADD